MFCKIESNNVKFTKILKLIYCCLDSFLIAKLNELEQKKSTKSKSYNINFFIKAVNILQGSCSDLCLLWLGSLKLLCLRQYHFQKLDFC